MKRVIAMGLILGCLTNGSHAGPNAASHRLPAQFFSEKTVLVAHINLEAINSDGILAAMTAILPPDLVQAMPADVRQRMSVVDVFVGQITALGITRVSSVSISHDPGQMTSVATYFLFPVSVSAPPAQQQSVLSALQQLAAGVQMQAEAIPGWVVVHKEQALPQEPEDVTVEDAAFYDALRVNPDHDLALAFVPTPTMAGAIRAALTQPAGDADDEQQAAVARLAGLADAEWYYLSLVLGRSPELLLSTRVPSEAAAGQLASAWDNALRAAKDAIRRQAAENLQEARKKFEEQGLPFNESDYDPRPTLEAVDALRATSDGARIVIQMDRGELATLVNGVVAAIKSLAGDLAEGLVNPLIPFTP
jgi:hypothetical protein